MRGFTVICLLLCLLSVGTAQAQQPIGPPPGSVGPGVPIPLAPDAYAPTWTAPYPPPPIPVPPVPVSILPTATVVSHALIYEVNPRTGQFSLFAPITALTPGTQIQVKLNPGYPLDNRYWVQIVSGQFAGNYIEKWALQF